MIITVECPSCNTTFPVDPRKVPAGGVKVRCSVCSGIFFVDEPQAAPAATPVAVGAAEAATAPEGPPESSTSTPEDDGGSGPDPHGESPPEERPVSETPVDDGRNHLDPWSGAGFDDHAAMGDSDLGDDRADPWSGGVDLPGEAGEAASEEPEAAPVEPEGAPASEAPEGGQPWLVERSRPVDFHEPDEGVERMETVEEQMRAAAAEMTPDEPSTEDAENPWDDEGVPPAAEAPVKASAEAPAESSWEEEPEESPDEATWEDAAAESREESSWEEEPTGSPEEPSWDAAAAESRQESSWDEEPTESTEEPSWEDAAAESPEEPSREAEAPESPVEASWEEAAATADEVGEAGVVDEPEVEPAPPAAFQFGKRDPHEKARRLARVLVSDMITYNPERHERALEQGTLHADFEEEIRKSWAEYTEQVGQELAESTTYWFDALNEILARGERIF